MDSADWDYISAFFYLFGKQDLNMISEGMNGIPKSSTGIIPFETRADDGLRGKYSYRITS